MDIEQLRVFLSSNAWKGLAPILGAVAAQIVKLIGEGKKDNNNENREDISNLTFAKEVKYQNSEGIDNLKNSFAFTELTRRTAPIHIVNLIFNCYDPGEAIYLYSKAPGYVNFELEKSSDKYKLKQPKSISESRVVQYIIFLLSSLTLVLSLVGIMTFFKLLDLDILTALDNIRNAEIFSAFLVIMELIFFGILLHSFHLLKISFQDMRFIKRVEKFYSDHDLYEAANKK